MKNKLLKVLGVTVILTLFIGASVFASLINLNFYNKTKNDVLVRMTENQNDPNKDFFQILVPAGELSTLNKSRFNATGTTIYIWAKGNREAAFKLMCKYKSSREKWVRWDIERLIFNGKFEFKKIRWKIYVQ